MNDCAAKVKKGKALIILSEGRSGTGFFTSRINALGTMGLVGEWLDAAPPISPRSARGFNAFFDAAIQSGQTENGNFAIKLFPRHVFHINRRYNVDFIDELFKSYDVLFLFIERKDRVGQAISFAKALQTDKWSSATDSSGQEKYDFDLINRMQFAIEESYGFWRQYLAVKKHKYSHFYYEDMVNSNLIYDTCSKHFGVKIKELPQSRLKVQRNSTTDEWRARFESEVASQNILTSHRNNRPATRTLNNLFRLLSRKMMKPFPYTY